MLVYQRVISIRNIIINYDKPSGIWSFFQFLSPDSGMMGMVPHRVASNFHLIFRPKIMKMAFFYVVNPVGRPSFLRHGF